MANPNHLNIVKQGVEAWNKWRQDNPSIIPDLIDAVLHRTFLEIDFSYIDLHDADLNGIDFGSAKINNANFRSSSLVQASLAGAEINGADFCGALLYNANFSDADAHNACFDGAKLEETNFAGTRLDEASFYGCTMGRTIFHENYLEGAIGLDSVQHESGSSLDVATILNPYNSLSDVFLQGCGVPDQFIVYANSLTLDPTQFQSCFISYSHEDEEFAQRLHARMRQKNLRVWYAAEDMAGGKKLHEQIEHAIQLHDRLLIVLSENSLKSEWVMTEIRKARKQEVKRGTRKLFPISLVDFSTIKEWECFDADTGKDLAVKIREYFVPDFSNWKSHDSFETAFARLYRDLKMEKMGG